jgi:hypothetical protein
MNAILSQLIVQAQQCDLDTQAGQSTIGQLTETVLRSRKICRPRPNQSLSGIYAELYDLVRHQLAANLTQNLDSCDFEDISGWLAGQRDLTFKQVLTEDWLTKLAIAAQQFLPNTDLRRHALRALYIQRA